MTAREDVDDAAARVGTQVLSGRFTLRELIEPEKPAVGSPAIWHADGPAADFLLKAWSRGGADDVAVKAVWNHEVRNLLRLNGLPRAREHFASLEALGEDEGGFYIVVDGGGRHLLSEALRRRNEFEWLRRVEQNSRRARLWEGLRRIAVGLEMLHEQGTLHRALRPGCVFTDMRGECDFRLSGFEWSLRLSAASFGMGVGVAPNRIRAPELEADTPSYSMASDWFDFGLLAAELVGGFAPSGSGLGALDALRKGVLTSRTIGEAERSLIVGLLLPNPDARRVECVNLSERVGALVARLASDQGSLEKPLLMAVRLSSGTDLAEAIYMASGRTIQAENAEAQLRFMQDDLADSPTLTIRGGPNPHYVLHGRRINYRVYKFDQGGYPTWKAGFCGGVDRGSRDPSRTVPLQGRRVQVEVLRQASAILKDPNSRVALWDQVAPPDPSLGDEPGRDAYDFLRFTNTVDALATAARIWPVRVISTGRTREGTQWVSLEPVLDQERDRMARALGLQPPARQMEQAFVEQVGEVDMEAAFHLVDDSRLGRTDYEEGRWVIYRTFLTKAGRRVYFFERIGGLTPPPKGEAFLRPAGIGGTYVLLERRLKAIEALREQTTMLRALEAPGSVTRDTMEILPENPELASLDTAKLTALRNIWRCQPMFALQGPPGTGKTKLVEAMVGQALASDPSLQIVATAQANGTVDALGAKISKTLSRSPGTSASLVVRLDEDEDAPPSERSPVRIAEGIAARLASSELTREAPAHIARRIAKLAGGGEAEGARERGDLANLVTRASNIVLATTNSRGLASLLDEGKRFDWCLVEEAGKAHGFDLALPMLASHRMLMIGDHEQLPAFNEATFLRLLSDPKRAAEALREGARFVPRKFGFDLGPLESDEAQRAFEARCARWHPMVRTFGHVFQESASLPPEHTVIAGRLTEQHRMHPDISDLIRACFYPDLRTASVARPRLEAADPFALVKGSWLPDSRVVFVDLPYVQALPGAKGQDIDHRGRKLLSSAVEAEAVVAALSQFEPSDDCELQLLAPYNRQVSVIRRQLEFAQRSGALSNLDRFRTPQTRDGFISTIDAFQGEEADVVIVSLVRNNDAALTGGVGFLSERPRLNVMLSRARRKLVLVGSWDFFRKRATEQVRADPSHPLRHLATVFSELERGIESGIVTKVPHQGGAVR